MAAPLSTDHDEQRLVERAQAGDRDAFGALALRYAPRLQRTIFRITQDRDAAEDVVQEALRARPSI